jgi:hypothetical protein
VAAPLFDGCIVFWTNGQDGNFSLTAFNLTSDTFSDVWTSQGQTLPDGCYCEQFSTTVIGSRLYLSYGWEAYSFDPYAFTSTVIYTSDLSTFTTLGNIDMQVESMCNYTGGGPYDNCIYFGGYQSMGLGTYSVIDVWYNGADVSIWNGTVLGSDDCCFLTMFNSTCMIGSDCAPNDIIYTNDGVNFVDEYTGSSFTSQYPFDWAWGCYVQSGTAYIAACSSPTSASGLYYGGMATWTGVGTYTPTLWYNINLYTVSNTLVGGSDNLLNGNGWTGAPAIYMYNPVGGQLDEVWHNSADVGAVLSLTYNNGVWYGIYYDAVSQSVTVISVGDNASSTIVVPDDYSTIQSAVNAASPGDTVYVRAGTYDENVQVNEALSLVGESSQDTIIDGGDVQNTIQVLADNVTITGFTVQDDQPTLKGDWDYADIALFGAGCNISGDVLVDSFAGVDLFASANSIAGNEITNNDWGVYVGAFNPANPSGAVANNDVVGNNITSNNDGVAICGSAYDNSITGNNIAANGEGLMLFQFSHDNNIVGNTVEKNGVGVDFKTVDSSAYDNVFYHNNFVSNAQQVISGGLMNVWDNGYPSGGNYWSDYTGTDLLNGPYQNQTGSDGIGDTPYFIDLDNVDNYPLMGVFSLLSNDVSAVSNSTVSDFVELAGSYISLRVSGLHGTTGFCTLTIPYSAMPPPYTLFVDGHTLSFTTVYDDGMVCVIYFTYKHSEHKATITSAVSAGGGGGVSYMD